VLLALAGAAGCATGGFDLADLPDEPLAIVYRTREESERRVELLQQAKGSALKKETRSTYEASYLRLEAAAEALGLGRSQAEKAADLLGHIASVDPERESATPYDFGFRGDRPLDWSEDRSRLLFVSLRSTEVQLYEWDRTTGDVRALTTGPEAHPSGCYGPEGRLALTVLTPSSDRKKKVQRIHVTEPGGGSPRVITPGPDDAKPDWSPEGRWIAYETKDAGGRPAVAVIPADGSAPPRVVAQGADPSWSPDGGWIVYAARTRRGFRLYQMRPDGSGKRAIGGGSRDEHDPRVSPDGRYVVYVYDDEGRQQLRVRTIDGRKDRPLLFVGDGIAPAW
jgi:hypothetical protein